jgi:chorismate--pyruvate lyase
VSIRKRLAWRDKPPHRQFSPARTSWLHERGSLTARLQTRGSFAVQVLSQGLALPTFDEAVSLGAKPEHLLWVREVALRVDGVALVFAHTILPRRPRGPLIGALAGLGKSSLGALLFAHPGFARGAIGCKRLDRRHALFRPAIDAMQLGVAPPKTLWARRSRFAFGAQSVLVTEVFSPALCAV